MPPHNGDDFMGDDVEIGLVTDIRPEHTIQKLYKSGSNKLLTTTIPKSWSFRMALRPGDYIAMELSADSSQIVVRKVNLPFKEDSVAAAENVEIESLGAVENADVNSVPLSPPANTSSAGQK